jgi:hypothetical protein
MGAQRILQKEFRDQGNIWRMVQIYRVAGSLRIALPSLLLVQPWCNRDRTYRNYGHIYKGLTLASGTLNR